MATPPRVRFRDISKSFAGVRALADVSFDVCPGSVHALVGENGAGKSTLMRVLSGDAPPDSGWVELDGVREPLPTPRAAQAAGVAIVHQELSLVPELSVAENVFLGRWPCGRGGWIDRRRLAADAAAVLRRLGAALSPAARVADLRVAQQQMVEIAKALSLRARVLVLDEPSAVLTPHELAALFDVVRSLVAGGASVIYISHRLDEVFALSDRVTVLRDGQHVSTGPTAATSRAVLVADCVGRPIGTEFPAPHGRFGGPVLRVAGLTCAKRCADVGFSIRSGEVFALAGLVGSGRSSVARAIFGALPGARGRVQVGERIGPFRSPRAAQRAGVAFVPEDRRGEGLLMRRPVRENITLAHRSAFSRAGLMRAASERAAVAQVASRTQIRAAGPEAAAATLSGGNQQKLMLARWLLEHYPLIILDEPTRGVDVGAKAEIYRLIAELAAAGTAVLLVSSELPEVIGLADRIGVMCAGKLACTLENFRRDTPQETILRWAVCEGGL
ncbi:MAG: sugar ABC transporter ATP-binding protein [Phycisphaerae bacterium]